MSGHCCAAKIVHQLLLCSKLIMAINLASGIFGLIIAVIIATNITVPKEGKSTYSLFSGYAHLGSGLTVGLSNLATGLAMGMAGEIGVQDSARQPKLYIGMVLIWSFGSALGAPALSVAIATFSFACLYGLIVALIIAVKDGSALCGCQVHADGSILCVE
eukprot:scaffold153977_cov31-Tisochrysis_lutea.AAC.2